MRVGIVSVPRVSDDDGSGRFVERVPGVWSSVLRARRDYSATHLWPYVDDPRMILWMTSDVHAALARLAAASAEESYVATLASRESVTVGRAILRGLVPNDVLFKDREATACVVSADDTIMSTA